ncbi:MAG: hypothetical protein AAB511_00950 [Patescibacteria group bacterium]
MNTKNYFVAPTIALLISLSFWFTANTANATVGGPTFVHSFSYNPADESVYYIMNSQNGRGCPPELLKLSLASNTSQVVYSCDEGESLIQNTNYDFAPVNAKISDITEGYKRLIPIHLKNNNISVSVDFHGLENISPEVSEIKNAKFTVNISQDNKKLAPIPIVGCNNDQPFTLAGYAIPGFEKKIIILLSTKGDCWEGGYIRESLHVVGGISDLDKNYTTNYYKEASALVPNEGTLVVSASDESSPNPIATNTHDTETPRENASGNSILFTLAIIVSLIIGGVIGKRYLK